MFLGFAFLLFWSLDLVFHLLHPFNKACFWIPTSLSQCLSRYTYIYICEYIDCITKCKKKLSEVKILTIRRDFKSKGVKEVATEGRGGGVGKVVQEGSQDGEVTSGGCHNYRREPSWGKRDTSQLALTQKSHCINTSTELNQTLSSRPPGLLIIHNKAI